MSERQIRAGAQIRNAIADRIAGRTTLSQFLNDCWDACNSIGFEEDATWFEHEAFGYGGDTTELPLYRQSVEGFRKLIAFNPLLALPGSSARYARELAGMIPPEFGLPPQQVGRTYAAGVAEFEGYLEGGFAFYEGDWIPQGSDIKYPDGRSIEYEYFRWQVTFPPRVLNLLLGQINRAALSKARRIESVLPESETLGPEQTELQATAATTVHVEQQHIYQGGYPTVSSASGRNPKASSVVTHNMIVLATKFTEYLRANEVEIDDLGEVIEGATVADVDQPDSGVGQWIGRLSEAGKLAGKTVAVEAVKHVVTQILSGQIDPAIFPSIFGQG